MIIRVVQKTLPLILALLISVTSAQAAKRPDWISGTSSKYPADTYLLGIGIGPDLDTARSNARAEISKVFQTRVLQSSEDMTREAVSQNDAEHSVKSELNTRTFTEGILQGVEIRDTWFDKKKKLHYALALLNKPKTRSLLMQQISDTEETIQSQLNLAKQAVSPVDQARALNRALRALDTQEIFLAKKRIVDPAAVLEPGQGITRAGIQKQRDEACAKILFAIDADDSNTLLRSAVGERVTRAGFHIMQAASVKHNPGISLITITCRTSISPVERNNPQWKFYNWQGSLEMTEKVGEEKIIATASKQGQTSHINENAAKEKAYTDAAQEIAQAVEANIRTYIFGE